MYTIKDLVFVGLSNTVVAMHRLTGTIVWENRDLYRGYTTLLLDGDQLVVSSNGYIYGFDALTGRRLWNNPLTGYGEGTASLASVRGGHTTSESAAFEEDYDDRRRRS